MGLAIQYLKERLVRGPILSSTYFGKNSVSSCVSYENRYYVFLIGATIFQKYEEQKVKAFTSRS